MPANPRRLLAVVAALGLVVSLSAACSKDTPKKSGPDRIINVYSGATGQFTQNFNPFSPQATHGTWGIIYETLMFFNQAKSNDVQPVLATKYEFADGGRSLTFTLRDGVKWNDGKPFTAEDVAFNFLYRKNNPKLNTGGSNVVDAKATDPTHATITFTEPVYTQLPNIAGMTWIVPKHVWEPIADPTSETNPNPVATGAFMMDQFTPQSYTFKKNPNYWEAGKPKIAGLRFFSFNSGDAGTAAIAAGQIDWAGNFMPDIEKQYVSKDPAHNKWKNEAFLYVTNLIPNLNKAPLNDLAVRQAINVALDRKKIIDLAFAGLGLMPSPLEMIMPTYQDWISPKYRDAKLTFDVDQANKILDAAGWVKGSDGIRVRNGQRLSFTCSTVTGWTDYLATMQVVTEQLKAVGIEFKAKELAYPAYSAALVSGDFEMAIYNGWGGPSPYFMYKNILDSKSIPPANQNNARWKNSSVDAALKVYESTPPDQMDTLKQAMFQVQDAIMAELPYIPIQQSSALAEFRTVNATGWPSEADPYALALPFYNPDNGIVAKNLVPTP